MAGEGAQLFMVATPIGNLEDVTLRALRILREVDVIAAEDTRVASRLLAHHGIAKRAVALHRHNEKAMADKVVDWLAGGQSVALITDAGTPGVSDPGAIVVAAVRAAGRRVTPIPGPSALAAALSVAGLDDPGVLFCGFLPASPGARRKAIEAIAEEPYTLVFYEAPHRVLECVADLAAALGERRIVFARELTKLFESVHECALQEAFEWLKADDNRTRGEFVLLVSGALAVEDSSGWERTLQSLLAELPLAQAVRLTCTLTGAKRKPVYERALQLNANADDAAS